MAGFPGLMFAAFGGISKLVELVSTFLVGVRDIWCSGIRAELNAHGNDARQGPLPR